LSGTCLFSTPGVLDAVRQWLGSGVPAEPDWDFQDFLINESGAWGEQLLSRLLDLDNERLQIMDENGVDVQVLSLTAPGVQPFGDTEAVWLATETDLLADAIGQHPTRYAGWPRLPRRCRTPVRRRSTGQSTNSASTAYHQLPHPRRIPGRREILA